jgi:Mannosyltransferase (PIG-V)
MLQPLSRPERRDATTARMTAVRDSWRALWISRLLVWVVGVAAVGVLGLRSAKAEFDPRGLTSGLGRVGELLAGPAARWDAAWYLTIAKYGYQPALGVHTVGRAAYFPAYPLAIRTVGLVGIPLVVAGVLVSLCAFAASLYGIHRLTTLEFAHTARLDRERPEQIARLAVLVIALAPMAVFFSAIYTESIFLAFSVALFWCARQGRWMWVGVTGALAVATRSPGVALALPALVIYLYGPREDRLPDRPFSGSPADGGRGALAYARRAAAALRPRYRLRRDILWLALFPVGLAAYCGWLALSGGEILAPFKAEQALWGRQFAGPLVGLWDGARTTFEGLHHLFSRQHAHVTSFAFLLAAVPAIVGVLRRLPLAYGLYVLAAIGVAISYPAAEDPLLSLPRFLLVLFPLGIWLAAWLTEHPRLRLPLLMLSALLMAFFVARFATWSWAS